MSTDLIAALAASIFGSSGAAWVGVRVALNGTREKVREMHGTLEGVRDDVTDLKVDVAHLKAVDGVRRVRREDIS